MSSSKLDLLRSPFAMRVAAIPVLALPLLLTYCGAKGDLIIGELQPVVAGSPSVIPTAGANAAAGASSAEPQGGVGGAAGSATNEGGAMPSPDAGAPNGGASEDPCPDGEEPPTASLIHRYSFDGTGTAVTDSVGDANGTLVGGAALDGSGVLALPGNRDGQPDEYADLPNGLISSLNEVTIVAWTMWQGGAGYQRVFDFGMSDIGEGQGASGKAYLAVMASTGFANGTGLGAEIAAPGYPTLGLGSTEKMDDRSGMVGLSLRSGQSVALFLDGKLLLESPTQLKLSDIKDVNDFVGESQWSKDHPYHGTFTEFRIYNVALTACQQRTLANHGPDVP